MDIDRLLLVSEMKICSILVKYTEIFFSLLKPKVVHLRPSLSSITFPEISKQNFISHVLLFKITN